ncbi:MAG TPA: helix-turn-helix domain-containing protein [Actinophytocola sp.]|uniref:helix-turn-helix transcriptional regulator n=1 Tax=Actinophytocola sp. TaxID=1872138 RepID=UPI002F9284FA
MDDVAAIAALGEPTRRRLYTYVVRQPEPVTREEVAAALRIPRATVAFHLDKLVAEDLLTVTYERRGDRAGPGAGRPAKLYRRSDRQVSVTLPERRYEFAGHLLAAAIEAGAEPPAHARAAGELLASGGGELREVLERHGFEPAEDGADVVLRNCPFHALAQAHPQLMCGMMLGLVEGMLAGLGETGYEARPDPGSGRCCVRLRGPAVTPCTMSDSDSVQHLA